LQVNRDELALQRILFLQIWRKWLAIYLRTLNIMLETLPVLSGQSKSEDIKQILFLQLILGFAVVQPFTGTVH
jgi:hypothetical protein